MRMPSKKSTREGAAFLVGPPARNAKCKVNLQGLEHCSDEAKDASRSALALGRAHPGGSLRRAAWSLPLAAPRRWRETPRLVCGALGVSGADLDAGRRIVVRASRRGLRSRRGVEALAQVRTEPQPERRLGVAHLDLPCARQPRAAQKHGVGRAPSADRGGGAYRAKACARALTQAGRGATAWPGCAGQRCLGAVSGKRDQAWFR